MSERITVRIPKSVSERFESDLARLSQSKSELVRRILEEHYIPSSSCHRLVVRDEWFICVVGREGKPPQITKLAELIGEKEEICKSCKIENDLREKVKVAETQVHTLETKLKEKVNEVFKIPKCNSGAVLNHDKEDNLIFRLCPKHSGPVSVDKFCKIQQRGTPCMMYATVTVGVGSQSK